MMQAKIEGNLEWEDEFEWYEFDLEQPIFLYFNGVIITSIGYRNNKYSYFDGEKVCYDDTLPEAKAAVEKLLGVVWETEQLPPYEAGKKQFVEEAVEVPCPTCKHYKRVCDYIFTCKGVVCNGCYECDEYEPSGKSD